MGAFVPSFYIIVEPQPLLGHLVRMMGSAGAVRYWVGAVRELPSTHNVAVLHQCRADYASDQAAAIGWASRI